MRLHITAFREGLGTRLSDVLVHSTLRCVVYTYCACVNGTTLSLDKGHLFRVKMVEPIPSNPPHYLPSPAPPPSLPHHPSISTQTSPAQHNPTPPQVHHECMKCTTLSACIAECAYAYQWRENGRLVYHSTMLGLWFCNGAVSEKITQISRCVM